MNPKSCHDFNESIGALVDGHLEPIYRAEVEAHLRQCAACRTLAADLTRIRDEASKLPPVTPPITLWPRVSTRLRSEIARHAAPEAAGRAAVETAALAAKPSLDDARSAHRSWWHAFGGWLTASPLRVASVAGAVLVVTAITTALLVYWPAPAVPGGTSASGTPGTAGAGASAAGATSAELVQSVEQELQMAEQHYEKAIAGLEQITKAEQGSLDPAVAETLQKNLGIIDQAIRDSRAALTEQPASELAQESLFEAFRRKVNLLQDTVALINEMRKGNQAGAARIIQKVNQS